MHNEHLKWLHHIGHFYWSIHNKNYVNLTKRLYMSKILHQAKLKILVYNIRVRKIKSFIFL